MDLEQTEDIALARGNAGLGFNIKGGIDIPHVATDYGIFVTKIREDGAAFSDGRLKEGDKILAVNGKSLEQVTHQEAVALFMNAGETVKLRVQHGAEERIKKLQSEETLYSVKNTFNSSDEDGDDSVGSAFLLTSLGLITSIAVVIGFIYYRHRAS